MSFKRNWFGVFFIALTLVCAANVGAQSQTFNTMGAGSTGRPAGGAWTPASASSLFYWFKSDTGVLKAGGGAATAGTDNVHTWQDQSGNNHHVVATAAGDMPYAASVLNGFPGIDLRGIAQLNNSDTFSLSQPMLIFAVFKTGASFTGAIEFVMDGLNHSGSGREEVYLNNTFGDNFCHIENNQGGGGNVSSGTAVSTNTGYWLAGEFNGASSAIQLSNSSRVTGTAGNGALINGFSFGYDIDGGGVMSSYLVEIWCIPNWTAADKTNSIAYAQSRYGL